MHFTYSEFLDINTLKQGDILQKTEALSSLVNEIHPHYISEEYTHFQVLTQSCDLVRRNGKNCKSRYITLAAVRGLDIVIKRAIHNENVIEVDGTNFCSENEKYLLADKLKKLYNNNDKDMFFLKAMPEQGLTYDSCTFLLLSIAIRAYEHYDVCLNAKILELKDNFQSKLGWLVGNLYSRVGTEDYVPNGSPDSKSFEELIDETLQEHIAWVPHNIYKDFKKSAKTMNYSNYDQLIEQAKKQKDRKEKSKLDGIVAKITKVAALDDETKEKVKNTLAADPLIQKMIST